MVTASLKLLVQCFIDKSHYCLLHSFISTLCYEASSGKYFWGLHRYVQLQQSSRGSGKSDASLLPFEIWTSSSLGSSFKSQGLSCDRAATPHHPTSGLRRKGSMRHIRNSQRLSLSGSAFKKLSAYPFRGFNWNIPDGRHAWRSGCEILISVLILCTCDPKTFLPEL